MKTNWKNIAIAVLVLGGGIGVSVAAFGGAARRNSNAAPTMSDSAMVSTQSGASSCEMCPKGNAMQCTDGDCSHGGSMANGMMDQSMVNGDTINQSMSGEKISDNPMAKSMQQSGSDRSSTGRVGSAEKADKEGLANEPKM